MSYIAACVKHAPGIGVRTMRTDKGSRNGLPGHHLLVLFLEQSLLQCSGDKSRSEGLAAAPAVCNFLLYTGSLLQWPVSMSVLPSPSSKTEAQPAAAADKCQTTGA